MENIRKSLIFTALSMDKLLKLDNSKFKICIQCKNKNENVNKSSIVRQQ